MKESIKGRAALGFTLVELIVVIVILGILAATALPKYINYKRTARIAALSAMQGSLQTIMLQTQAAYYAFPSRRKPIPYSGGGDNIWMTFFALNDTTDVVLITSIWANSASRGLPIAGPEGIVRLLDCSFLSSSHVTDVRYNCGGFTATNITASYSGYNGDASANFFPPGVTPEKGFLPDTPKCFVNYRPGHSTSDFLPSLTLVTDEC